MTRNASVVFEKDEHRFYAWCPRTEGMPVAGVFSRGCRGQYQGCDELYLETLPSEEREDLLSPEILTTTVEVNA
jgi:hypothetical protein